MPALSRLRGSRGNRPATEEKIFFFSSPETTGDPRSIFQDKIRVTNGIRLHTELLYSYELYSRRHMRASMFAPQRFVFVTPRPG